MLLTAERRALSCVCAWQGYRLCYEFSAQGLVNVVQELLNGRNGHDLCGWVFVGFGAGRERAESQADEMFNLCGQHEVFGMNLCLRLIDDTESNDLLCRPLGTMHQTVRRKLLV